MQKSDNENLMACRRKLRTLSQQRNAAFVLLKKLRDAGTWNNNSLDIHWHRPDSETGKELLSQITDLVGAKDA